MLYGGAGDDILMGGNSRDMLFGGEGADTLDGGAEDIDFVSYADSGKAVTVNLSVTDAKASAMDQVAMQKGTN